MSFGLALSSTAFCLKLLSERGGMVTPMGKISFSVLLLQDLAIIPLLSLVSYLAVGVSGDAEYDLNIIYSILVIIFLLLAGRYLLNSILDRVISNQDPEVFIIMAVLLVLGISWIMVTVGLSMALGSFLAGVMLAESHHRHQIEAGILPFRGILLGLFFMTVGMSIDFSLLWEQLNIIVLITIALMVWKAIVIYVLARAARVRHDISVQTGVLLSQCGEFGFVIFGAAFSAGILESRLIQMLNLIIAFTMILTPFVVRGTNFLLLRFHNLRIKKEDSIVNLMGDLESHVIMVGFGRVGARIAALLSAVGVAYIAIDVRLNRVKAARDQGFPVFWGDASKAWVLRLSGIEHAKMIVIAFEASERIDSLVVLLRQYYPEVPIYTLARDRQHCVNLITYGATTIVTETLETSVCLTEKILLGTGIDKKIVQEVINEFRIDYYLNVEQRVIQDKVASGELRR